MKLFLIIFGLSSGIMVGAGVISLLILVGIIPRMAQLSNTRSFINFYEKILFTTMVVRRRPKLTLF